MYEITILDIKLVENIEFQETLTLKNGEAVTDAVKELVFQTDEFDQLLNYLFEFAMVMPERKETGFRAGKGEKAMRRKRH